jgi:hypothetical protein
MDSKPPYIVLWDEMENLRQDDELVLSHISKPADVAKSRPSPPSRLPAKVPRPKGAKSHLRE